MTPHYKYALLKTIIYFSIYILQFGNCILGRRVV